MIRNHTDGDIVFLIGMVCLPGNFTDPVPERTDGIDVKHGIHFLTHNRKTLQAHTGIDILLGQGRIISVPVVFKLCENVIPDFHITVAVASDFAGRLSASVFFTAVVIDLGAGTAGAGTVFPEIILLAETGDLFRRHSDFLIPEIERLVIIQINGRIQSFRIQPDDFRQKFP